MTARRLAWVVGAAALVAALVVGTGILTPSRPTAAQRELAIESGIRCPSCEDLSVADSSAPTAQAVRHEVARLVTEGRTDQQVRQHVTKTLLVLKTQLVDDNVLVARAALQKHIPQLVLTPVEREGKPVYRVS
nr:cytochrome c-type biogenesis protein CcmH [Actinomycetota bacterium]